MVIVRMGTKGSQNRERIVEAADDLFYQQGYNQTSFAEVAESTGIPKGNFYYYFKSKDELLHAVIEYRLDVIKTLLTETEANYSTPQSRLLRIIEILANETTAVMDYGCPLGTLNAELGKTQKKLQSHAAQMFDLFIDWCEREFIALDKKKEAHHLALHLMALLQGAALLGNVYKDRSFIENEIRHAKEWIRSL